MPIFHDRIVDQVEELLPEFYQEDGPRFVSFIKSYFEFLEKGQLVYKESEDIDYIGLEDETIAGEAFNDAGQRGNLLQETATYSPSSITSAKFNYEINIETNITQHSSYEKDEFVVGSKTGAVGRVDVIGTSSNLYIEQFSEAQFDIGETIIGKTSGMIAKVASFTASPLHAANNLLSYADVDKTSGDFLEYFRRDFMPFIDRDVLANKRLLQKHVQELYLAKGTKESYEFLFRILYGIDAEVTFPGDNVIKPSESDFNQPTVMRLFSNSDLTLYKGGSVNIFNSSGDVSSKAFINDASGISGTNDTTNAYELELILPYVGTFNTNDVVTLSDRDGFRVDVLATVRGVMTDISTTESSIYLGQEDGNAGDIEDILRLESSTQANILNEDSTTILFEDGIKMANQHAPGGQFFQARPIGIEDGSTTSGVSRGILLSEESVYDIDGILITDFAILDENTDLFDADPTQIGGPDSRTMNGGLYTEVLSAGSLFTESDTFNYLSPANGTATQSVNVIGAIGRGGVTDIVLDDIGQGYSSSDMLVFINTGTEGNHAEANIAVTDGTIELETATAAGVFEFTGDNSTTVFSGRDNNNLLVGFNPRDVHVFVNGTEILRTTGFTTDQSGLKITFATAPANNAKIEINAFNRGVSLEDSLRTDKLLRYGVMSEGVLPVIASEAKGGIRKISITNEGLNYKTLPQVFVGGYIYYDTLTSGTQFSVGEIITESGGNGNSNANVTMVVVEHDLKKKRLLAYKKSTDTSGVPSGTITGSTSGTSFTLIQTNMTAGQGAKIFAFSDNIGSIKKLKIANTGHDFDEGGIGNYKQHCIIKDASANPAANTKVTAALTGATGNVAVMNGDLNLLSLNNVRGIFNDGDYVTTSDNKNFYIGKTNACTARGNVGGTALLDGNYLDDTGFPSADSMRIHDSYQYQDFSYKIKVGKSINDYRSLIKSLLSPAGTIFFGEVSIKNQVDGSAKIYDHNYDGTETTRSFIPTLIIGSKIDTADIELETGTGFTRDSVFASFNGRLLMETGEGVITTERFISRAAIGEGNQETFRDQSSGRPFIVGTDTIEESDRDFFNRQLTAEVTAKGSRVNKQLLINPHFNQHKLNYTTLNTTLPVGTLVRGTTSNALGIVMEHNTTDKFIILHRSQSDQGQAASQFLATEVIKNFAQSTTYFTATSIELHHAPEGVVTKQEPNNITADSFTSTANQKISNGVEGGGDAYAHTDYISGFAGRGKILVASDRSETYDSDMRQRKVNIISSPIFTQSITQRGKTFSAGVKHTRVLNTQTSRTQGSNSTVTNGSGSALRLDSVFNTTVAENKNGVSFGHRPAGQKLFETTSFQSERIMTEAGDNLIFEPQNGQILGEGKVGFGQGGIIVFEDNTTNEASEALGGLPVNWETATIVDIELVFVSEESSQIDSFNLIGESGDRLVHESGLAAANPSVGTPILLEEALMLGQKDSATPIGPSIGDLNGIMFTENYSIMKNLRQEAGAAGSSNLGDNLMLESGPAGGSSNGGRFIEESPSEGIRISDISTIYQKRFVTSFSNEPARKAKLSYSTVVQTG